MITYKLKKPFTFCEQEVSELNLIEPQAKHLKKLPIDTKSWTFDHMIQLVSELSGQPNPKIEKLSFVDLMGAVAEAMPFLEDSQETGDLSSQY